MTLLDDRAAPAGDAAYGCGARTLRVMHVTRWLSNLGGGIPVALSALARALDARDDVEVSVAGIADTPADADDQDWGAVHPAALMPRDRIGFGRCPELDTLIAREAPDILHLHGLWRYPALAAERWRRATGTPVVVSPHGMLEPWALSQSRLRKFVAGQLYQRPLLANAAFVQALSSAERRDIRRYGSRAPVAVIGNGIDPPAPGEPGPPPWADQIRDGRRVLLFLGRIHPKKNLPFLLDAMADPRLGDAARRWTLVVAGWDEAGHEADLRARVRAAGLAGCVVFAGPLFGAAKDAACRAADAFVLPSLSEGLPMTVLEAWTHGKPVLMTEACNLDVGFAEGAAARLPLDAAEAPAALDAFLSRSDAALAEMGARGRRVVARDFAWSRVAGRMVEAYRWSLGAAPRPDFVHPR